MASHMLEKEDHARDAAFNKALHGQSAKNQGGISSLLSKNKDAQKEALHEYFRHWDNKPASTETEEIRNARKQEYATLTRQYDLQFLYSDHLGLN